MAERPILFSGAMVRAILDGTKTQTRRVVEPQRVHGWEPSPPHIPAGRWSWRYRDTNERIYQDCPYGVPGDRLWVRETWQPLSPRSGAPIVGSIRGLPEMETSYAADFPQAPHSWGRWRSSTHMPRWASRITLEVTDVRVERLRDITEEDARAEGAKASSVGGDLNHRGRFRQLWDDLYAVPEIPSPAAAKKRPGRSWVDNPWVWAVSFRVEAGHG